MRRTLAVVLLLACTLIGCSLAFVNATYSPDGRELISLGYLNGVFFSEAVAAGQSAYTAPDGSIYDSAVEQLDSMENDYRFQLGLLDGNVRFSPSLKDVRFKRDDLITVPTGTSFLLLAGEAQVIFSSGAVIDLSVGEEVASDSSLLLQHRYLSAEDTFADIVITSDTAVLSLEGSYLLSPSTQVDYNMIADTMKTMGLFKGSDTGFGSGYDLEKSPTRLQSLIMFLRLIGEEQAALATTAKCHFTDVPAWAQSYVAYAYEQGYTKGISATEFGSDLETRAAEYIIFVLRAFGYSDSGTNPDFSWNTAMFTALQVGILTPQEHKMLTEQPFLRAQVVYISYYALDARPKGSSLTLYSTLINSGALDRSISDAARANMTSPRLR